MALPASLVSPTWAESEPTALTLLIVVLLLGVFFWALRELHDLFGGPRERR